MTLHTRVSRECDAAGVIMPINVQDGTNGEGVKNLNFSPFFFGWGKNEPLTRGVVVKQRAAAVVPRFV